MTPAPRPAPDAGRRGSPGLPSSPCRSSAARSSSPVQRRPTRSSPTPSRGSTCCRARRGFSIVRLAFWMADPSSACGACCARPGSASARRRRRGPEIDLPGVSPASIALSLAAFNLIFALQNGLDIAFLWSGAPLPEGMTLAEYAHRGAYPLIATALLAALFVLVTLRPGSPTAESPLVRRLVYAWIAQNVVLVASTMLRTVDYIEAYSLTRLRIAALIWMALVAIGLVLICVRLWRGKSGAWLINANLARRPGRPRRLLGRRPRAGAAAVERAPCPRGRRPRRPARPVLPQRARPLRLAAADRAGEPADRAPLPRAGRAGPAILIMDRLADRPGRLARLDLPQRPPPRRGEAADRRAPPAALLGERPRLRRPPDRNGKTLTAAGRGCDMYAMSHKILLVDDDAHIRQVLAFALGKAGMKTERGRRRRSGAEGGRGEAAGPRRPRHQHAEDGRARSLPADSRRGRSADPVPLLARRRDRPGARPRARRRRLCREALLARAKWSPGSAPSSSAAAGRWRRRRAEAGSGPQAPAPRSGSLGGALGRRRRCRSPSPSSSCCCCSPACPSKVFSRDAIIDRLHGPGFADHRPDDRQPYPQPARQVRAPAARDLIETRAGIGYRIGRCKGERGLIRAIKELAQAPLAGASAAHPPVPDPAVRRRPARLRRRLPSRL